MPLDKKSIVWGLLLSIVATGLYDALKALMEGDYWKETVAVISTVIVVFILFVAFHKQLLEEES